MSDTGGPAFPTTYADWCNGMGGVTLLDWLARGIQCELIRDIIQQERGHGRETPDVYDRLVGGRSFIAQTAYDQAEAMIAEKRRREGDDEHE